MVIRVTQGIFVSLSVCNTHISRTLHQTYIRLGRCVADDQQESSVEFGDISINTF